MSTVNEDHGPVLLRVAVLLLWVEAIALCVVGIVELVKVLTASPDDPSAAAILGAMILAGAYMCFAIGAALQNRRAWGVAAGMVTQASALPVAYFMVTGDAELLTHLGGVGVAALSVACLTCLVLHTRRHDSILRTRPVALSLLKQKGRSSAEKP